MGLIGQWRLTLACLTAALLATACDRPGSAPPRRATTQPDVVLISIDSLRADHLGCYGYGKPTSPTLDRLAADGARFEQAVSTTSWTLPAHAALFTGLYDSAHGANDDGLRLAEAYVTMAEHFSSAGYQTAGFYGGPYLHPVFGLGQGFQTYRSCISGLPDSAAAESVERQALSTASTSHTDVTGPRTLAQVEQWLRSVGPGRMLLFVHLWDVHFDYIPPPELLRQFDPDYSGSVRLDGFARNESIHAGMAPRDLQHIIAAYDGEIRFTDDIVAQLLERLEAARPGQPRLVVVTADHGDEFFEHGQKGHRRTLHDEVVRVPLIIQWPDVIPSGVRIPGQVSLVDVLPTILGLAGLPPPQDVQGRDLSPWLFGESMPPTAVMCELLSRGRTFHALRSPDFKLVFNEKRGGVMAYDLKTDPEEKRPRPRDPERLRQFQDRLNRLIDESREIRARIAGREATPTEVAPDLTERLRSLGYLGDSPSPSQPAAAPPSSGPSRERFR